MGRKGRVKPQKRGRTRNSEVDFMSDCLLEYDFCKLRYDKIHTSCSTKQRKNRRDGKKMCTVEPRREGGSKGEVDTGRVVPKTGE
jgi:hypothetical protein